MKRTTVDYTLKKVFGRDSGSRFDLIVLLKINTENKPFAERKSYNIDLRPSIPIQEKEYQLLFEEFVPDSEKDNCHGFRKNDVDAEIGIGTIIETGEKYYFVRVQLSDSIQRACYLPKYEILNLKFADPGLEFEEKNETLSINDVMFN